MKNLQNDTQTHELLEIIHELNIAERAMKKATEIARKIGYPVKELEITEKKLSYISSTFSLFVK